MRLGGSVMVMPNNIDMLRENGFDVDTALRRVMGKEESYIRILKRFPADGSFKKMKDGLAEKDVKKAFEGAHTLKGISGNMGITAVFAAAQPVVEILRDGSMEGIGPYVQTLETAYTRALNIINEL
jgi:HPt (histidine-containing phosphotransfer) domain-containing protein